jgi:hypothetical protein
VCSRVLKQTPEELDVAITLVHLLWEEGSFARAGLLQCSHQRHMLMLTVFLLLLCVASPSWWVADGAKRALELIKDILPAFRDSCRLCVCMWGRIGKCCLTARLLCSWRACRWRCRF